MKREARGLEDLHSKLRRTDKSQAMAVMSRLNIELTITPVEDEIDSFPSELMDQVEQIDGTLVELHLSVARLNKLQRSALGLQADDTTIVHLKMTSNHVWVAFCVHFRNAGVDSQAMEHCSCRLSSPEFRESLCDGETNYLAKAFSLRLWGLLWPLRLSPAREWPHDSHARCRSMAQDLQQIYQELYPSIDLSGHIADIKALAEGRSAAVVKIKKPETARAIAAKIIDTEPT